jgi:hypothetical protein
MILCGEKNLSECILPGYDKLPAFQVNAIILPCIFNRHYVPYVLDNADERMVTFVVSAYVAYFGIGNIMAKTRKQKSIPGNGA